MRLGHEGKQAPVILIVDDNPADRRLLRVSLEECGFAVLEAEDGVQGVAAFETRRPDLVILNLQMPGMDGVEACAAMRQLPGGGQVPILVLTGPADRPSIQRAYEAGGTDFMIKPVNGGLLEFRVRSLLRAKAAFEELQQRETRLAQAQRIAVDLNIVGDEITVTVQDDGRGFDPDQVAIQDGAHFGLSIMRARAARIAGEIKIDSLPGQGTRVILTWPSSAAPDNAGCADERRPLDRQALPML